MIKIFLTIRNRLAISKKCIEALERHTKSPFQLYVYDNQTNYLIDEHFDFLREKYKQGVITQLTFTSDDSNFNAFSKASTFNFFGHQHEQDPNKDKYDFLLCMDNDIILMPGWDKNVSKAWTYIKKNNLKNVHVVGQLPGGIKYKKDEYKINDDLTGIVGQLGGSGLWAVKPSFFKDIGYLDLKSLISHHKMHDQLYWRLLTQVSENKPYIMGLNKKLGVHLGKLSGSVCNQLTRNKNNKHKLSLIKFEEAEEKIDSVSFEDFFEFIKDNKEFMNDW